MKRSLAKRIQKAAISVTKPKDIELQKEIIRFNRISKCASCPSFPQARKECCISFNLRQTASVLCLRESKSLRALRFSPNAMPFNIQNRGASTTATEKSLDAVKQLSSVCACPAACSCLPPPCNTPAKCLQYMTGYYYYPYGTWFCGPYHVSTGSCPVSGPVKPGGPCGPILPCPGDPCGPVCCACKPLTCCGVCGIDEPVPPNNESNANNPWQFGYANMYSPYNQYQFSPYADSNSYSSYNSFTPYGYYNSFSGTAPNFGPCINVPIVPVPIPVPSQETESYPAVTSPPAPKSAISWPLSKANINQDTKVTAYKMPIVNASVTPPTKPSMNTPTNPNPNNPPVNPPYTSNVTPKTTYPPSNLNSKPNLSKGNPYMKPRINARTLQPSSSIGICYFSTKFMRKYHKNGKIALNEIPNGIETKRTANLTRPVGKRNTGVRQKSIDYWGLLSNGKYSKNPRSA